MAENMDNIYIKFIEEDKYYYSSFIVKGFDIVDKSEPYDMLLIVKCGRNLFNNEYYLINGHAVYIGYDKNKKHYIIYSMFPNDTFTNKDLCEAITNDNEKYLCKENKQIILNDW